MSTIPNTQNSLAASGDDNSSQAVLPATGEAGAEVEGEPSLSPLFTVHDEQTANWVVRKVMQARQYAQHVEAWAAAEVRRAENEERFFLDRFARQLEQWAAQEIQKLKGRRRSLNLPAGTLGFRAEPPRLLVTDEQRLLAWCIRCLPEAVKLKLEATGQDAQTLLAWQEQHCPTVHASQEVAKHLMNKHALATGEVPDGVEPIPATDKFYIK
ncbi:MAG TPA: host-nuclease inhibitor Gam family protein [Tepidisphaeraceae bacterium]|jgi:hypothetical protein